MDRQRSKIKMEAMKKAKRLSKDIYLMYKHYSSSAYYKKSNTVFETNIGVLVV